MGEPSEPVIRLFGILDVTGEVIAMWIFLVLAAGISLLVTRNLKERPGRLQNLLEIAVSGLDNFFSGILGRENGRKYLFFLGPLFCFIILSNYSGLIPGVGISKYVKAPTSSLSVTLGLGIVTFVFLQGAAFIYVATSYDNDTNEPGALPTHIYTSVSPAALDRMRRSFRKAKADGAMVLASFHMGRMHSTDIQQYQIELAHAAVDAGAEMVFAHHPHTLLGIEMYRGKPIFYSIGHFIFATDAFLQEGTALAEQRKHLPNHWQGVNTEALIRPREPITDTIPFYVGDQASRNTLIAKGVFHETGLARASFIPCWIDDTGHPVPVRRGEKGDDVLAHIRELCRLEQLDTRFAWSEDGTEVWLS